jgi:ABC-type transport system involved in multi-copper enzyme maturation permease subunit
MNTAIFWRLVWKEYRQQRSLWIAIAMAGLIFQIAALVYCTLQGVSELPNVLFTVALSVPILYSLGCGATLFAGEHEAGTFPFQQSLPVEASRVFWAKCFFAVASGLMLFPLLWLLAFAMTSWKLPDANWHLQLWSGGVVATIEVLVWAALASLALRRVLPAAIVSGGVAVLLGYSSLVVVMAFGNHVARQTDEYFSTLPIRSVFALIALAMAARFGRQWFNERPMSWVASVAQRPRFGVAADHRTRPATGLTVFGRLVWHEWRQCRLTMLWCSLGYLVLCGWMVANIQLGILSFIGLLPLLAVIFGASVFAADQRQGQYQFFAERGVRPRLVWLSRQVVWITALICVAILAVSLQALDRISPFPLLQKHCVTAVAFTLLLFVTSQLCSILIRSGIVAIFSAVICSVMVGAWAAFMSSLGVPWTLTSLPLPFIFLWASWFYAPKWIQQRHTWRVRTITAATIVVPLTCVSAATFAYRVVEIPLIKPSFDLADFKVDDSLAARETAVMYEEPFRLLGERRPFTDRQEVVIVRRDDQWQKGIDLFVAASQRETCYFPHRQDEDPRAWHGVARIATAVMAEANARTKSGDLEGAVELYFSLLGSARHAYQQRVQTYRQDGFAIEQNVFASLPAWANHESVSVEQVQQAIDSLQEWIQRNPIDLSEQVIEWNQVLQRLYAMDEVVLNDNNMTDREKYAVRILGTLLPWERWRALRLLNVTAEAELQGMREVRARGPLIGPLAQQGLPWDVDLTLADGRRELLRSSDVQGWLTTTFGPWNALGFAALEYVFTEQQHQVYRTAVLTQLALIAWRKQHGELPETLSDLIGDSLTTLPLDPFTKQPLVYFSEGIEEEIWDSATNPSGMFGEGMMGEGMPGGGMFGEMGMSSEDRDLPTPREPKLVRSEPLLWSPAELTLRYAPSSTSDHPPYVIASDFRDDGQTLFDSQLLHLGKQFFIPYTK